MAVAVAAAWSTVSRLRDEPCSGFGSGDAGEQEVEASFGQHCLGRGDDLGEVPVVEDGYRHRDGARPARSEAAGVWIGFVSECRRDAG
jgi:hypothetical protein